MQWTEEKGTISAVNGRKRALLTRWTDKKRTLYVDNKKDKIAQSKRPCMTITLLVNKGICHIFFMFAYWFNRSVHNSSFCIVIELSSILFYSILFYSILFYSILFYSILFYSILFSGMSLGEKKISDTFFPKHNLSQLGVWGRCKRGPGRSPGSKRILATIYCKLSYYYITL